MHILIDYDAADLPIAEDLWRYLRPQMNRGEISVFYEQLVQAGFLKSIIEDEWRRANLLIKLLSPSSLDTRAAQMDRARALAVDGKVHVVPVVVSPCDWESGALGGLVACPMKNGVLLPVKDRRWSSKDEAIKCVADAIAAIRRPPYRSQPALQRQNVTWRPAHDYISRPHLERLILDRLEERNTAILTGTHRCGKSRLIQRTLAELRRDESTGVRTCHLDFIEFANDDRNSGDRLYRLMATRISESVKLSPEKADDWVATYWKQPVAGNLRMRRLMEQQILVAPGLTKLVLALDHVNELEDDGVRGDLFRMLRAWSNESHRAPWSRLQLILSATISLNLDPVSSSPFSNIEYEIPVGGLSDEELCALIAQAGCPYDPVDLQILREEVDGNAYYCTHSVEKALQRGMSPGQWLRAHGRKTFEQDFDAFLTRPFSRDPELREILCGALLQPRRRLSQEDHYRLLRTGLFAFDDHSGYRLIYKLFEDHILLLCGCHAAADGC